MRTSWPCTALRTLLLGAVLASGGAHADLLASHKAGAETIGLDTEPCAARRPGWVMKQARKTAPDIELAGCWWVNRRGNPVVRWDDGAVEELQAERLVLAPRYQAALQRVDALESAASHPASGAVPPDFARPAWCRDAKQPHERLICRDPQLSAADLALAPLWRAFRTRMNLGDADLRYYKSSFYRRLKGCGGDRTCIANEQAVRTRLYRIALGLE